MNDRIDINEIFLKGPYNPNQKKKKKKKKKKIFRKNFSNLQIQNKHLEIKKFNNNNNNNNNNNDNNNNNNNNINFFIVYLHQSIISVTICTKHESQSKIMTLMTFAATKVRIMLCILAI